MAEESLLPSLEDTNTTFTDVSLSLTKARMLLDVYMEVLGMITPSSGDPRVDIDIEELKLLFIDQEQMMQDMQEKWDPMNSAIGRLYQYFCIKLDEIKKSEPVANPVDSSPESGASF